jgi:hypothetical protein
MVLLPGDLNTQKVVGPFADEKACKVVQKQAHDSFQKEHGGAAGVYLLTTCTQEKR